MREGSTAVNGRLPPEVIQRIVRQNFGRFRLCYENGARTAPSLKGRVSVRFVIDRTGAVVGAADAGSDLPTAGPSHASCTASRTSRSRARERHRDGRLSDPVRAERRRFAGGRRRTDRPRRGRASASPLQRGRGPRVRRATHPVARAVGRSLVRERGPGDLPAGARGCEAPTWRDGTRCSSRWSPGSPPSRSAWRCGAGCSATRRPRTWSTGAPCSRADARRSCTICTWALGLRSVDPTLLAAQLARAKTPVDRLTLLHGLALQWPDDLELGLGALDAYEDAGDDGGGRAWARRLRHRADATPHVYTNVGEYYLRLSKRETGADATRDADEARRTFGELVEFAPEDPVARTPARGSAAGPRLVRGSLSTVRDARAADAR